MPELDLDQRLRDDAARQPEIVPPPLDAALARLDVPHRRHTGRVLLAVAACVLLVAGLALALTLATGGEDGATPVGGPSASGLPPTRGSEVLRYVRNTGFDGALLVPGEPRALDVLLPYGTNAGECSVFEPQLVITQDASTVRVRVAGYQYLPKPKPGQDYVGFTCAGAGERAVRVTLDEPLGDRTLRDAIAADKRPVVPGDPADFPSPAHLPAGFHATATEPASAAAGRDFASRTYGRGDATLVLEVGPPDADIESPLDHVLRHVDVDGHRATLTGDGSEQVLRWSEGASGRVRQLVYYPGHNYLSADELVQVARSLS